ncbi:unnamed protein product, partial [Mesorhabditis belari]|uniref:Uncharacterized protein n=1 Tax=Mesorhabditis belari TaxID=2138241 RepID=A0AAF3ESX3_9BILA
MDKKSRSEAARKEALAAKKQLEQERALAIKISLSNKDANSKRKVFDSDGELENDDISSKTTIVKQKKQRQNVDTEAKTDSNSGGFDQRFQLDERFIDDHEEQFEIPSTSGTKEIEENESVKKPKRAQVEELPPQKVNPGQYYEMDTSFLDLLKKNASHTPTSNSFTFLKPIDKQGSAKKIDTTEVSNAYAEKSTKKPEVVHREVEDSSGEENEDYGEHFKTADLSTKVDLKRIPFFFTGEEPEIRSVVSNFRRTQDEKKIEKVWNTYRQSIQRIVNHMKRNARRNIKERGLRYNYGNKKREKEETKQD